MRIGHISDLHLYDMTGARVRDFLNKRMTGGLNLLLGRRGLHQASLSERALQILKTECDHLVVAGDLTNLSLPSEFVAADALLRRYFDEDDMTIVPGNHDFYTKESALARRFEKSIYSKNQSDLAGFVEDSPWPFVKIRNDVAFIGLNSAQPRPFFVAAGMLGREQRNALIKLLKKPELQQKFIVIALHHHLFRAINAPGEALRNLRDRAAFLRILKKYSPHLVLHGHNHVCHMKVWGNTLISEAGSLSEDGGKRSSRRGKFKIYEVNDNKIQKIETWRYNDTDFVLFKKERVNGKKIEAFV